MDKIELGSDMLERFLEENAPSAMLVMVFPLILSGTIKLVGHVSRQPSRIRFSSE